MNATAQITTTVTSALPIMRQNALKVAGAFAIATSGNADHRGDLTVLFHALANHMATGVQFEARQVLCSRSRPNVVRGMHAQARAPQAKIVTCVQGRVFDVVYDARPSSPTFGMHDIVLLESPEHAVYVPTGCLHGFYSLDESTVIYAADRFYDPVTDGGVRWDTLGIAWPDKHPIASDKDLRLGTLAEWRARCDLYRVES